MSPILTSMLLQLLGCGGIELERPSAPSTTAQDAPTGAPDAIRLQALLLSSGTGAEAVLDGDPTTSWRPKGDPVAEGMLFRFEEPTPIRGVTLTACSGTPAFRVTDFVDGAPNHTEQTEQGGVPTSLAIEAPTLTTWSFEVVEADADEICVSEIAFEGESPIELLLPRTLPGVVEASSTLEPEQAYHPDFLFDGRLDRGWVEGATGHGAGEIVTILLDRPIQLVGLELWNGYQRSPEHFDKNSRARRLRLSADGNPWTELDFSDEMGLQRATFTVPLRATEVRVALDAAFPGSSYEDLVLSELRLVDRDGPLTVDPQTTEIRERQLLRRLRGKPLADIVDTEWRSHCRAPGRMDSTLKIRSNHTFAQTSVEVLGPGDERVPRRERLEGTWTIEDLDGAWSTILLYGRRTVSGPEPSGDEAKESPRPTGGRVRVARVGDMDAPAFDKMLHTLRARQEGEFPCPWDSQTPEQEVRDGLAGASAVLFDGRALSDIFTSP